MPALAHPLAVPLRADPVLSPRLVYGHVSPFAADEGETVDALHFPLPAHEGGGQGRVTFEGLDAVRASRGEYMPYEHPVPYARGDWVYEISGSPWLAERHAYELTHYNTPLIEDYRHYLLCFHDEFVEAIAQGIWFDTPDPSQSARLARDHPLAPLDEQPAETRPSPSGIAWELRRSPKDRAALTEDSNLCSQRLYQFNLVLDGESREAASVWLRTVAGRTTTRMKRSWVGEVARYDGVADTEDFFDAWERYVAQVAERRQAAGKPMS